MYINNKLYVIQPGERLLLFLLLSFMCLVATAQDRTLITSTVRDTKPDTILLSFYEGFPIKQSTDLYATARGGMFTWELPAFRDFADFSLNIPGNSSTNIPYLPVQAGDSIAIGLDNGNINFSGKGAAKCQFWYEEEQKRPHSLHNIQTEGIDLYFDFLDARERAAVKRLETYKNKLSPVEYGFLKADLVGYPEYKKMQNLQIEYGQYASINQTDLKNIFKKRVSNEPLGLRPNDTAALAPNYLDYLWQKAIVEQLISDGKYNLKRVYRLLSTTYKGLLREKLLAYFIAQSIALEDLNDDLEWSIKDYLAHTKVEDYKQPVEQQYNIAKNLAKGMPAYNFTLTDTTGKKVSLNDFKGKVIYMDFWASWCSPCRQQMKEGAPALHEKLKDQKDMVFLYISMDASQPAWKKAIQQDNIQGVHLVADNAMEGELAKKYLISAIPRYMIIDKVGKILDNNATRPSDPETYNKLLRYLRN